MVIGTFNVKHALAGDCKTNRHGTVVVKKLVVDTAILSAINELASVRFNPMAMVPGVLWISTRRQRGVSEGF